MKSATIQIAAIYVGCPTCGEAFQGTDDGSQLVSMHNVKPDLIGTIATCIACGDRYRIPKGIKKVFV